MTAETLLPRPRVACRAGRRWRLGRASLVLALLVPGVSPAQPGKMVDEQFVNNFEVDYRTISVQDLRDQLARNAELERGNSEVLKGELAGCKARLQAGDRTPTVPPVTKATPGVAGARPLAAKTMEELMSMLQGGNLEAIMELRYRQGALSGLPGADRAPVLPAPGASPNGVPAAGPSAGPVGQRLAEALKMQVAGANNADFAPCTEAAEKKYADAGARASVITMTKTGDGAKPDAAVALIGKRDPRGATIETVLIFAQSPYDKLNVVADNGRYRDKIEKIVDLDSGDPKRLKPDPNRHVRTVVVPQVANRSTGFSFVKTRFDTSYGVADITGSADAHGARDRRFTPEAYAVFQQVLNDFCRFGDMATVGSSLWNFSRGGALGSNLQKFKSDTTLSANDRAQVLGNLVLFMRAASPIKQPDKDNQGRRDDSVKALTARTGEGAMAVIQLAKLFPEIKHIEYVWMQPDDPEAKRIFEIVSMKTPGKRVSGTLGDFLQSAVEAGTPNTGGATGFQLYDESFHPGQLVAVDAAMAP